MKPVKRSRAFVLSVSLSLMLILAYAPFALAVENMDEGSIAGVVGFDDNGGTTTGGDTGGNTGGDTGGDTGNTDDTGDTGDTTYTDPSTNYDYTGTDDYAANVATTTTDTTDAATVDATSATAAPAAAADQPLSYAHAATLDFSSLFSATGAQQSDAAGTTRTASAFAGLSGAATAGVTGAVQGPSFDSATQSSPISSFILIAVIALLVGAVAMLLFMLRREQKKEQRIEDIKRSASLDFVQMTPFPEDRSTKTGVASIEILAGGKHSIATASSVGDAPAPDRSTVDSTVAGKHEIKGGSIHDDDLDASTDDLQRGAHSRYPQQTTAYADEEAYVGSHTRAASASDARDGEQRWSA